MPYFNSNCIYLLSSCADPENVQQGGQEQGREADTRGVETGPERLRGPDYNVRQLGPIHTGSLTLN